jgi:nitroreductase
MKTVQDAVKCVRSIRKYREESVPDDLLREVVDAGIWGPSLFALQPWRFVVVTNKEVIDRIYKVLEAISETIGKGVGALIYSTLKILKTSPVLICVYNTNIVSERFEKYGDEYQPIIQCAQIQSIAAAIQNMILVADSLNLGSCWLDVPLLCEEAISKILEEPDKNDLIAIVTLGFPESKGIRSQRLNSEDTLKIIP